MTALAVWFLAAFGFAFVVGHSKISLPLRQLLGGWAESSTVNDIANVEVIGKVVVHKPLVPWLGPWVVALLECPGCLGWHLGWLAVVFNVVQLQFPSRWVSALVLAFATSGVNLLLGKWVGLV